MHNPNICTSIILFERWYLLWFYAMMTIGALLKVDEDIKLVPILLDLSARSSRDGTGGRARVPWPVPPWFYALRSFRRSPYLRVDRFMMHDRVFFHSIRCSS